MEILGLLVIGLILLVVFNAGFRSGKRVGSRKGYGVGFDRGRRAKGPDGCLVVLAAAALALGAAAAVWAMF